MKIKKRRFCDKLTLTVTQFATVFIPCDTTLYQHLKNEQRHDRNFKGKK